MDDEHYMPEYRHCGLLPAAVAGGEHTRRRTMSEATSRKPVVLTRKHLAAMMRDAMERCRVAGQIETATLLSEAWRSVRAGSPPVVEVQKVQDDE